MITVKVKKILKDIEIKIPSYARPGDAGLDICAAEEATLNPGEYRGIRTGLAFEIPDGYVGLVWDKSGLSFKYGLHTFSGVLDSGYRGELILGVRNLSNESYTFEIGDKVAQLLIQPYEQVGIEESDELNETERGLNAFGSTGK